MIYEINPLCDERWPALAANHASASVFHSRQYLETLTHTYGYKPMALTTAAPGEPLSNAVLFCEISSWLTGKRLVSLPFSDHCAPLLDNDLQLPEVSSWLQAERKRRSWKYTEFRPVSPDPIDGFESHESFAFHTLDLRPELDDLFRSFSKDSIQRRIKRAEKAKLDYRSGITDELLGDFYGLMVKTRRRQQLPPQPISWFRNLLNAFGEQAKIRIAYTDQKPIAAIFTLSAQRSVVYKYGCSDEKFNNLGATPFLFWNAIQESKSTGAVELDFGRSDLDNAGLIRFKDQWGTKRSVLRYFRYPSTAPASSRQRYTMRAARHIFSRLPDGLLSVAGTALYRHVG